MLKKSASREKAEVQAKVQAKVEDKIKNIRSSLNLDLNLSPSLVLRSCWTAFLSILQRVLLMFQTCRPLKLCPAEMVFPYPVRRWAGSGQVPFLLAE